MPGVPPGSSQMQGHSPMPMQSKAPGGPHGPPGGQPPQRERPQRGPQSPARGAPFEAGHPGPGQLSRALGLPDDDSSRQQRPGMRSPERQAPPGSAPAGRSMGSTGMAGGLSMAPGGETAPARPPMGSSLERFARMTPGPKAMGAPSPDALPPMSMTGGPPPEVSLPKAMQQASRESQGPQGQPAPGQAKARPPREHVSEGRIGAIWRVLKSDNFEDVLVREAKEVTGAVVRRVQPDELLEQKGATIENESGLVRMPVAPRGWVTVHARNINGPTFMEIVPDRELAAAREKDARVKGAVAKKSQPQQAAKAPQQQQPRAPQVAKASQEKASPAMPSGPPAKAGPSRTSPARERPAAAKQRPGEDGRQIGPRDSRTSPPLSRPDPTKDAPSDDPFFQADPWSKANHDPWAAAAKGPPVGRGPPPGSRSNQATRPPPSKASASSQPQSSATSTGAVSAGDRSGPSYSREDMLHVRSQFLGHPAVLPIRTIRIPTLEGSPAKRRDRERSTKRPADDDARPQPGGASADFLRKQSPARERDSSSQQRPGLPLHRGPGAAAQSGDAAAVGAGNANAAAAQVEQKPKEETKANCPTQ